jgi:hypothetical protein
VKVKAGKCWGTAFEPKRVVGAKQVKATFVFDCNAVGFYEIDLKILEQDAGADDVAAEFGDIIDFDEGGNTTSTADGGTKFQFSKILTGTCLQDGPGEKSEFFSRLRYRIRGSLEGPDSEDSTWRTVSTSDVRKWKCKK